MAKAVALRAAAFADLLFFPFSLVFIHLFIRFLHQLFVVCRLPGQAAAEGKAEGNPYLAVQISETVVLHVFQKSSRIEQFLPAVISV